MTRPLRGWRARVANEPRWLRWLLAWDWDGRGTRLTFYLFGRCVGSVETA